MRKGKLASALTSLVALYGTSMLVFGSDLKAHMRPHRIFSIFSPKTIKLVFLYLNQRAIKAGCIKLKTNVEW